MVNTPQWMARGKNLIHIRVKAYRQQPVGQQKSLCGGHCKGLMVIGLLIVSFVDRVNAYNFLTLNKRAMLGWLKTSMILSWVSVSPLTR